MLHAGKEARHKGIADAASPPESVLLLSVSRRASTHT